MAYNMNTDYAAIMNEQQKIMDSATPGTAAYTAAQNAYNSAQTSRNEKIAAMNAAGTNTNNYTTDYKPATGGGTTTTQKVSTPVTYIDADGNKKTGYIIDGLTYTDAAGTNRIGTGSSVQTSNGDWYTMTDTGGKKASSEDTLYYNYLTSDAGQKYIAEQNAKKQQETTKMTYLQQQLAAVNEALETAQSSNDAVLTAQLQQQQANIQAQIENLNSQYNAANKQLYVDAMKSKRDLPQALAALGYTGGLRESSLLGIDTDYANQVNANEIARAGDIASIQNGANSDATDLYIAQLQANQDAQDTYTTRYLNILQAMAEQEQAEKEAEQEAALEKAALMQKLGDTSSVYSLLGLEQPAAAVAETVDEGYTGNPTPAAETTRTLDELKLFKDVAKQNKDTYGEDAAIDYLLSREQKGYLTSAESELILNNI